MTFKKDATTLATVPLVSGTATFDASVLPKGIHYLAIDYSGDAAYSSSGTNFYQAIGAGRPLVTGPDAGRDPNVRRLNAVGNSTPLTGALSSFFAFDPAFRGGVRVAEGDVNGDGVPDTIAAAGLGGWPQVSTFDGATGALLRSFFAFEPTFTGGVYVAAGDVNGDGYADVVVGSGAGRGGQVRVFSGVDGSVLRDLLVFAPDFIGGVRVGAGDVNGDGYADVVAGTGSGPIATVTVLSGADASVLRTFAPYESFTGGVFVAAGDVTGDGFADIITGPDSGGPLKVQVFDGLSGSVTRSFFAFSSSFTGGVRVAAGDMTGDGLDEIILGPGPGIEPYVYILDPVLNHSMVRAAYVWTFTGGVFVATAAPQHRMVIEVAGVGGSGVGGSGPSATSRRGAMLTGWAFVEGPTGTGVSAIEVWAQRVGDTSPVFVGTATRGDARPDVAVKYGQQYALAGFHLSLAALPPGTYDVMVFAKGARTGTSQIARTVRITKSP
jgi:hypothetical protein